VKFKPPRPFRKPWNAAVAGSAALALAVLLVAARPAAAQDDDESEILEPQALRLQVADAYLGVLVNGDYNQSRITGQNGTSTDYSLFFGPDFGLDAFGSIYHPNFINFTINGNISPGYLTERGNENGVTPTGNSGFAVFGNYLVNVNILQEKPYRATLYLDQSYSEEENDLYNEIEVNTLRYGANLGYQSGPVPFTLEVWRQQQTTSGAADETSSEQEYALIFAASNKRAAGDTALNYSLSDYTLSNNGGQGGGLDQAVGLNDVETFGSREQFKLNSAAGFNESDNAGGNGPGDDGGRAQNFLGAENFSIQHSETLTSSYDASYYYMDSSSSDGTVKSEGVNGDISLSHQLFESLTSSLTLAGMYYSSSDNLPNDGGGQPNSSSQTEQFSGGLTEAYTKRLGPETRLSMTGSIIYEYTTQKDTGDTVIQNNEAHTFSSNTDSFFLNLPDVDQASIVVTNNQGALPAYQLGIDYTISQNGSLTMIRRTATASIPETSKVLVTYTAAASPSGQYDTLNGMVNLRVDFWNGLLGVYARYSSLQNFGAPVGNNSDSTSQRTTLNLLAGASNVTDVAVGADATWHWLHGGFECESYNSTYSSYTSLNVYQSLTFSPDRASSVSLNLGESLTRYSDSNDSEEDYSITTDYHRAAAQNLSLDVQAGVEVRRGAGVDQTLAAVRPKLRYYIGQTSVDMGYSFEYSKYLNSTVTTEQYLYVSIRRTF